MFRFRLQTMLVLVTAFSIALGLVTRELNRERWRKQNAAEVRRLGGSVRYDLMPKNEQTSVVNGYLRIFLGDEYFTEVKSVSHKPRTEADLDLLRSFPEMTDLSLDGAPVALERLSGLPQLERLNLAGVILSERGLKLVTELPKLRYLHFARCTLAVQSLKSLTELPNLKSLDFTNCVMCDECLKSLRQCSNISLCFRNCSLADSNLRSMHGARASVHLRLLMTNVTEAGILAIREANPAWSLHLSAGIDNGNYFPSIQKLPKIGGLTFSWIKSDATLAILKDARSLTSLNFDKCCLTDAGLQYLRPLQNLKSLSISGAPITDEGLRALEGLTKLQFLSLTGSKIEGLGLGRLPSSIRTLVSDVTDRGVAEIAKLTYLEELWLENTLVSDEGIDSLAQMDSLRRLYLLETSISETGLSRLQQALPNCVILTK